jgi:hypothetical protein
MRSSVGPEEPISVADLLDRHGEVLTERAAPLPGPRRPLSERMRRTLIAVGSVLAAGGVLGGAVAVSSTGHEAPLGRSPGGLFDQLDPGPAATGDAADAPVNGLELPAAGGAHTDRIGSTAVPGGIPQPRAAVGPADASTAPTIVVVPQQQGGADTVRTADRSAPGPTAARAVVPAAPTAVPVPAGVGTAAQSGASAAPTAASGGSGSGTGLLGGVTKAVGDLLHS